MKFYTKEVEDNYPYAPVESVHGDWVKRVDAEQAANERDELKRKGEELCLAYGRLLMEFNDAKRDAVEMARWVQTLTIDTYAANTVDTYKSDRKWKQAQMIIDRYEGGE